MLAALVANGFYEGSVISHAAIWRPISRLGVLGIPAGPQEVVVGADRHHHDAVRIADRLHARLGARPVRLHDLLDGRTTLQGRAPEVRAHGRRRLPGAR